MALITEIHHPRRDGVLGLIAAPFKAVFDVLVAIAESRSRIGEIQKLQAMSDAQLAERGLKRDTIVQHVFRDKFYI